jgi:hypothetical protein
MNREWWTGWRDLILSGYHRLASISIREQFRVRQVSLASEFEKKGVSAKANEDYEGLKGVRLHPVAMVTELNEKAMERAFET